jgi:hypothetical protein
MIETRKIDDAIASSIEFSRLQAASFAMPPEYRAFAEKQVLQGKETFETLSSAVQEACSKSLNGFSAYAHKVAEAGLEDADAVCDCCRELVAAKSMPEVMNIWTTRAPRHFDAMSNRTGELWALYWKVATDAAKPIAAGMAHAFARSERA